MMKILHKLFALTAYLAGILILLSLSCTKQEEPETFVSVTLSKTSAEKASGSLWVKVSSNTDWSLSLDFGEAQEAWAELSRTSGSGEENDIVLSYKENTGDFARTLTINVRDSKGVNQSSASFTQQGSYVNTEVVSDPVYGWMELPAVKDEDGLYFFTHYQTVGSRNMRSWSYQWDSDALVAHWVAYPLNKSLIGSGNRTNAWGLDPKLPSSMQPVLHYRGFSSDDGKFDRGHQLPSADRLNREANIQTFYGTNMTPQMSSLNQNVWASLEGFVRDKSRALDTLYVVTGCTVEGSTRTAYDNLGKVVTVPTGYFKVLLGYKKDMSVGITASTAGYTGIAFWFEHQSYSGSYWEQSMTVAELEEITGIDFFCNLPARIGNKADVVESSEDDWWRAY